MLQGYRKGHDNRVEKAISKLNYCSSAAAQHKSSETKMREFYLRFNMDALNQFKEIHYI